MVNVIVKNIAFKWYNLLFVTLLVQLLKELWEYWKELLRSSPTETRIHMTVDTYMTNDANTEARVHPPQHYTTPVTMG